DPDIDFAGGLARGFGDDRLVALAVGLDLPPGFALIPPGLGVAHNGQAPFLEFVDRGVDVPGDVVAQIFTHQSHQVVARIADMVFGLIFVPMHAHVAVDRIKPLGDRAAALDIGFFDADDFQIAPPVSGLIGGAAAAHAAADDEDVGVYEYGLAATHQPTPCLNRSRDTVGNAAILSASGSC